MTFFHAIVLEQTQTEFGIVPKTQEYYISAINYTDAEKIFKELINRNMICNSCISDENGKLVEFKKILKEEIEGVIDADENFYYKVIVKFNIGEGTKTAKYNFYIANENINIYDKLTKFISNLGYMSEYEIISIVKKDKIETIFDMSNVDYKLVYDEIIN